MKTLAFLILIYNFFSLALAQSGGTYENETIYSVDNVYINSATNKKVHAIGTFHVGTKPYYNRLARGS